MNRNGGGVARVPPKGGSRTLGMRPPIVIGENHLGVRFHMLLPLLYHLLELLHGIDEEDRRMMDLSFEGW